MISIRINNEYSIVYSLVVKIVDKFNVTISGLGLRLLRGYYEYDIE